MFSFHSSTKQLSDSGIDTAIISVGATEGCGPCLPLHLDNLVAEYFARAWGRALEAYVLPTLPYNTSEEHAAFKGTITLRPATVMLVLGEIVAALSRIYQAGAHRGARRIMVDGRLYQGHQLAVQGYYRR